MERKNVDKGFTLIELIISIAILSIVGLAIFGFMATSSNLYGREVTQADLQYESQLVINQLQDMLIDASRSVTYIVTVDGTETEVLSDAGLGEAAITQKEVRIYNGGEYYKVTWDKDEERLYYSRYVQKGKSVAKAALGAGVTADTGDWEADPDASHVRMADYVKEFSADITDLEKNRSVKFQFLFQINNISYATQHNITLRNKVVKGIGESGEVTVVSPEQDSISISPQNITLWPGDPLVFTHTIRSKTGNFPSQEADWTLSSSEELAADTVITGDGQLQVSLDEKSKEMMVTVTAREGRKQEDGSILRPYAYASVRVKQVKGLTVELTKGGSYPGEDEKPRLIPGSTLQFKTTSITGYNINSPMDLTAPGVTITWEVVKGADFASVDGNGMLTVSEEAPVDTVLQVKAIFNRAGREWAYGYSNEYVVVRLKERGVIYVDTDSYEYEAPEGELWINEPQKIAIDWSQLPDIYKNEAGNALKPNYQFYWQFILDGKSLDDTQGFGFDTMGGDTSDAGVFISVPEWMNLYKYEKGISVILKIYDGGNRWNGELVYESNELLLEFPYIHYQYSYSKTQPYTDEKIFFVTPEIGEVYVYYDIYGFHEDGEVGRIEQLFTNYTFTNSGNFTELDGPGTRTYIKVDMKNNIIRFIPEIKSTSVSNILHLDTAGKQDGSKLTVYFKQPNVEDSGYYVPLPTDTSYKDSGYLFGDCSYEVTTQALPAGKTYYKLVITDNREGQTKTATAYWKEGNRWQKDDPYAG